MFRGPIRARGAALIAAAMLAGTLMAASVASARPAAGAAAAPSTNLGGANYNGYCRQLGFVRSEVTPSKEWACMHADGTTSPLDVQAACEFTYTQRPIAAVEITPGVPFTWQCFVAQPGHVLLPEGTGTAGGSPLAASVRRALVPTGRGAKIGTLVRRGRYTTTFQAPRFGRLTLSWYYQRRHARRTLVATATVTFSRAGGRAVTIALTAKGKRLLKHASRLAIGARGAFVANASNPVGATAAFTLRR